MATTAQNLIDGALRLLGVISAGGSPSTAMSNNALVSLNMMISSWGARSIVTRALVRESFSIASSAASYSIGVGQTINTAKPLVIASAFTRDSNGIDTGLDIITREQFDAFPDKDIEGLPHSLFYDPGLTQQATQIGTIYLYPEAEANRTLFLESEKQLTQIASLATALTFELYYEEALKYNLAIRLAPEYEDARLKPEVVAIAKESFDVLTRLGSRTPRALMDFRRTSRANILSGE